MPLVGAVLLVLVPALVGFRPAAADEPLVPDALSGTFTDSPGGFFVCTLTPTSPVDVPDCFLGYEVPGERRLRAVGGGFQRSSNFTVLEEVWAAPGALTIGTGTAAVEQVSARSPCISISSTSLLFLLRFTGNRRE